jgi:hypothetical protein
MKWLRTLLGFIAFTFLFIVWLLGALITRNGDWPDRVFGKSQAGIDFEGNC